MRSLLLLFLMTTALAQQGSKDMHWLEFDGVDRPIITYLPTSYNGTTATPLVLVFHGGSGNAEHAFQSFGVPEVADHAGFIAVFLNGLPRDGGRIQTAYWGDEQNVAYVAFVLERLREWFVLDDRRIYAVGFSGGAKLIYRLAADPLVSAQLRAIATVAGEMGGYDDANDPQDTGWAIDLSAGVPLSAFVVQGGQDVRLPLDGGYSDTKEAYVLSFADKVSLFQDWLAASEPVSYSTTVAPARVSVEAYQDGAQAQLLVALADPALAHRWPQWPLMREFWLFFEGLTP